MKRLLLLLLLFASAASAQVRIPLKGNVTSPEGELENVHIRNVTSRQIGISDGNGGFRMSAAVGDTLLFTHISMLDLVKIITREEVKSEVVSVLMQPRDQELDEVILEDYSGINAVSLGIISEKKEIPTTYERRLQTAGDFKWYHLFGLLAGSFELDPLLNAINGRTKEMKRNIIIEKQIQHIEFLTDNYMDYMRENFEAPEGEIQKFLDYLVEQQSLQPAIDAGNADGLKFYLTDQWYKYVDGKQAE